MNKRFGIIRMQRGNALVLSVLILLALTSVGLVSVQRTNTDLGVAGNLAHGFTAVLDLLGQGSSAVLGASGAIAGLLAFSLWGVFPVYFKWIETVAPLEVLGYQYDLACNGYELVSGAIRNHKPDIMFKAFEIAGYGKDEVEKRFGGMVNAFQYGAPPHGGCAAGIDRIVMLLADEANIREVIMFPMNQRAEDLMMGAPSEPMNEQLRELRLRVLPPES